MAMEVEWMWVTIPIHNLYEAPGELVESWTNRSRKRSFGV